MPRALTTIEKASAYLEEACKEMKMDPYSQNGRDRLITGSRGILQGTTAMLVAFDESQVIGSVCHLYFIMISKFKAISYLFFHEILISI